MPWRCPPAQARRSARENRGRLPALNINPFELHEECVKMVPGDWLVYRFTSQRPVAFNIHYHEGKTVIMPVAKDNVTMDDATFRPLIAQEYCMMWEAGREGAIIEYRIVLSRGTASK